MNPGLLLIKQEIKRRGPLTFRDFVDIALYHPHYGYYNQKSPVRGKAGDYFTSLQVSDLFPKIFADAVIAMRETLDSDQFTLIEMGSGGGEFLEGVLNALKEANQLKGLRVWSVERSRGARDKLWRVLSRFPKCHVVSALEEIDWIGSLEGCVVSNELFDALPFHRLRYHATDWREIFVDLDGDTLVDREGDLSDPRLLEKLNSPVLEFEEGQEVEVRPGVDDIFEAWDRLMSRGYAVTFDYGFPRHLLYSPTRPQGTWNCFSKHRSNQDPYGLIGRQDITAHVDFTQLTEAGRAHGFNQELFCSQGIFLSYLGQKRIEGMLAGLTDESRRPVAAAVQQLIHPGAMGEKFWTLAQAKSVGLPDVFKTIPNRSKRVEPLTAFDKPEK